MRKERKAVQAEIEAAKKSKQGEKGATVKRTKHKDCGKLAKYNKAPANRKANQLEADHVPSGAALKKAAENELRQMGVWDKLGPSGQESVLNSVYNNASTITVPTDVHSEGRTYKSKNTKAQIAADATDLNGAARKDTAAIQNSMNSKDHGCGQEYAKAAADLLKTDFNKYVKDAVKGNKAVQALLKK